MTAMKTSRGRKTVVDTDYRALAEFRYHIRKYLEFSDQAAREAGVEPRQYEVLLAIRGVGDERPPTVGVLAHQLCLRHHSVVELIDRAEANDLVSRQRDGTYVRVTLTGKGEGVLARAVEARLKELRVAGPALVKTLQQLIGWKPTPPKERKTP
jgi:DNA-binding MarR family transcriptional regulator